MPDINRIRVNNIKYNFATQSYDDFVMRMYGKNTLYDLANGGGKSILMLLLLQNLIPNCTLDEKQPVEKLFRTGGGNTTIHSLIEWRLDDKDIREGFRYMTTGFCARKAKDATVDTALPEDAKPERSDSASVEYFNYCIFYRDYNENDIVNLPLQTEDERITYTGLRNYLRDLGRRNRNLRVYLFERKGEYQRFISRYGLFESQWEIIRGINKTEGHVRTYFETHYKTTRKVVEDLLIEEIIEKAFRVKTNQGETGEDMAQTLLDIRDKLAELSLKKKEIANYDRETELMQLLEGRISSFLHLYEERMRIEGTLADVYVTGERLSSSGQQKIREMQDKENALHQRFESEQRKLETLKILRDQYDLDEEKEALSLLADELSRMEKETDGMRRELALRESGNDYLRYLEDRARMTENRAMIDAATRENGDCLAKLQRYAYTKKQMDNAKLASLRGKRREAEEQLRAIRSGIEALDGQAQEDRIAAAVARSQKERFAQEYQQYMEQLQHVRKDVSVMMLGDLTQLTQTLSSEAEDVSERLNRLRREREEDLDAQHTLQDKLKEEQDRLARLEDAYARMEEKDRRYRSDAERLRKMRQIYRAEETGDLCAAIRERMIGNRVAMAEEERRIAEMERLLERARDGRGMGETEEVIRVKDYLESRHGEFAVSGVDYLCALPEANRKDLLERFPLLPYGVVTEHFDVVRDDAYIETLDLKGRAVPVFDRNVLESPYLPEKERGVLLIAKDRAVLVDADALAKETERIARELAEEREELAHMREMASAYAEDMEFASGLADPELINAGQEMQRLAEERAACRLETERIEKELEQIRVRTARNLETYDETERAWKRLQEERIRVAGVMEKSELADAAKRRETEWSEEEKKREDSLRQTEEKRERETLAAAETENRVSHMMQQERNVLEDWENLYRPYDTDAHMTALSVSEEQLRAEFLALKAVADKADIALADKKKLVAAFSENMERDLQLIRKRGVSAEELERLSDEGKLEPAEDALLDRMSEQLAQLAARSEQQREAYKQKEGQVQRLTGRVEQEIAAYRERFHGEPESLPVAAGQEVRQAIAEGDRILEQLAREEQNMREERMRFADNQGAVLDMYKDVKRIIDNEHISCEQATVLEQEPDALREIFEDGLLVYDRSVKAIARAKQELMNDKNQTANTLFAMGETVLSDAVRDDIQVPETYEDAKLLLANMREMTACIALEKERVEQGIADMEAVKKHFENQCIERCRDVRTELEKLPKLSAISLDGETVQMTRLTVPYVKDEFVESRMSDYIDEVVNGADRFADNRERLQYLRSRLMLKKLFGVMVTDMNAIRLKLYKRERMREQSRYLRYEEAVGSTGQSQGIYIQFLVSIINYISGMYAPEAAPETLKKVIFIDNPFGAAKDIYIWEPIFALLETNHVQLIVPARGATPAITNRFDVNYILGQRLVGDRQQTVVVDYRSQVEQDETEYENLEYTQGTLDFI